MERRSVEALVEALEKAGARYLIVGGLAVVAHGFLRFTADVDLFLELSEENLRRALQAMQGLGYRPRAPVPLEAFADERQRRSWVKDKNLKVFSLHSPAHAATEVDLFVEPPMDFEAAWSRAVRREVGPGVQATFAGLSDLLAIKEAAGRDQDLEDVRRLREIAREATGG